MAVAQLVKFIFLFFKSYLKNKKHCKSKDYILIKNIKLVFIPKNVIVQQAQSFVTTNLLGLHKKFYSFPT